MRRLLALLPFALLAACADTDTAHDHGDSLAAAHAGDSTRATAMAQEPTVPVATREVDYGPATGYAAVPQDSAGVTAGLIVIHEWWGLNENVETMARRFAGEGYRVLAVDLYDGKVAATPDSARVYVQQAFRNLDAVRANVTAAYEHLRRQGVENVGVLGWCAGGAMSLQAALALPTELDAAVIYYGNVGDATVDELRTLQMPVRGFFGEADGSIPVAEVQQFEQRLQQAGGPAEITIYPGAGHAFANPTGNNYQEGPAQDSWRETLAFLDEHLKTP